MAVDLLFIIPAIKISQDKIKELIIPSSYLNYFQVENYQWTQELKGHWFPKTTDSDAEDLVIIEFYDENIVIKTPLSILGSLLSENIRNIIFQFAVQICKFLNRESILIATDESVIYENIKNNITEITLGLKEVTALDELIEFSEKIVMTNHQGFYVFQL